MTAPDAPDGPVPVRDLLRQLGQDSPGATDAGLEAGAGSVAERSTSPSDQDVELGPAVTEQAFEMDGVEWLARPAGLGCYGTGRRGMALLQAVHFYRADEPDRPVREALLSASRFPHLDAAELPAIFARATPVELQD